jgi:hypothetical protein
MRKFHLDDPPIARDLSPPCVLCGMPMFLSHIEPAEAADHDRRIFECLACQNSQTVVVRYR